MKPALILVAALALLPLALFLAGAETEGSRPASARVPRAKGPAIAIDGKLDDPAWKEAARLELRRADGKAAAARRTEVRLLHDGEFLYAAFSCEDPDIWTDHRGRDSHMWTEDVVEIFLDLDPREPGYVELEVSPAGDLFDGIFFGSHQPVLMSWNPDIRVKAAVDGTLNQRGDLDRSWTVEMAIPVKDLAPSSGVGLPGAVIRPGVEWRVNFYRGERSGGGEKETRELQAWSPVQNDFHATALFGKLAFE